MMNHAFTKKILRVLEQRFSAELAPKLFEASPLLQYLNIKTRAAERGSKSRASFASHYALYVLIEDYIKKGYADKRIGQYSKYKGARFSDLLQRQRELPFGAKLQNHALNSRLNDEFSKYFRSLDGRPILRQEQRYWARVPDALQDRTNQC